MTSTELLTLTVDEKELTQKTVLRDVAGEVAALEANLDRLGDVAGAGKSDAVLQSCMLLSDLLPGHLTPQILTGLDVENSDILKFISDYYEPVLHMIFRHVSDWVGNYKISKAVERLVVVDGGTWRVLRVNLQTLENSLSYVEFPSKQADYILDLLKKVLKSQLLASATVRGMVGCGGAEAEDVEAAVQVIVSIAARVANKTKGKKVTFFLEKYPTVLYCHVATVVGVIKEIQVKTGKKFQTESFYLLIKKLLVCYGKHRSLNILLSAFEEAKLWPLVKNLVRGLNNTALEKFTWALLNRCKTPVDVWCYLGNLVLESEQLRFLLTVKWTVLSYHDSLAYPNLIPNLVGYLGLASGDLVIDLLDSLLTVWGSRSAIYGTVVPQRLFLCQLVVRCASRVTVAVAANSKQQHLRQHLLDGVSAHLDCNKEEVRALGMATAEIMVPIVLGPVVSHLNFDYTVFSEETLKLVEQLRGTEKLEEPLELPVDPTSVEAPVMETMELEELDSDDDLLPYAVPEEAPPCAKRPRFLRDLATGLADRTETERHEACKAAAGALIRAQLEHDDAQMAIELLDLLTDLGMEPEAVEAVCACPAVCARHLVSSLEQHRSISSHLQTLNILDMAAVRLHQEGRFLSLADSFFFPLVQRHNIEDPIFLTKLLSTLMRMLIMAKNSLSRKKMQEDMYECAVAFWGHHEAGVRLAALNVLVGLWGLDEGIDRQPMVQWLETAAHNDPDVRIRHLASYALSVGVPSC